MVAQGLDQDGMLRLVGKTLPATHSPSVVAAKFWAAGFSFSRAQFIHEVAPTNLFWQYLDKDTSSGIVA